MRKCLYVVLFLIIAFIISGCVKQPQYNSEDVYTPPVSTTTEEVLPPPIDTCHLLQYDFKKGMGDFVGDGWKETENGIENTACGWDAMLYANMRTDFDSRKMLVTFIPKTENVQFLIGNKNSANLAASTFYGVDFSAQKLQIYPNWNNDSTKTVTPMEKETVLPLAVGQEYILSYERTTLFCGKVILQNAATGESDSFEINTVACKGWDNPAIIAANGTVEVEEIQYFHTMPIDTKLAVFGDSFIEGANLGYQNIADRYVQRIADKMGEKIFIDSRGGESVKGVLNKYKTDALVNAEYTLLAIGTNDYSYDAWLQNMKLLIKEVEANGSIPILVTVSRRTDIDNLEFIVKANAWVRSSGYAYLDVAKALSLEQDGETINTELYYQDMVHPNVAGHGAIYERALEDLYFLFED